MAGRRDLKRSKGDRATKRRFLLYCEGECTEHQYFSGLKSELRSLPLSIEIGRKHGEPLGLVKAAADHKERAHRSAADRYVAYDEVWCVIDVEAPQPHGSLDQALTLAKQHKISIALSNPCFELWILLHYRDQLGRLDSSDAVRSLEKHGDCNYLTDRKHLEYSKLVDHYERARERAEALRAEASLPKTKANPWTDVDLLVERLKRQ